MCTSKALELGGVAHALSELINFYRAYIILYSISAVMSDTQSWFTGGNFQIKIRIACYGKHRNHSELVIILGVAFEIVCGRS